MRRLGTCLASTNREALGFRPALKGVCHCELAGRGTGERREIAVLKGLFGGLPSPRKNGPGF